MSIFQAQPSTIIGPSLRDYKVIATKKRLKEFEAVWECNIILEHCLAASHVLDRVAALDLLETTTIGGIT